jgi:hypothetical protein
MRALFEKLMVAKAQSTKEVESPLSVLLLRISVRFARLFHCELDGESYEEKRPGLMANWSVDVCSVSRLGRFVLLCEEDSLSSPQATVARWLRYWIGRSRRSRVSNDPDSRCLPALLRAAKFALPFWPARRGSRIPVATRNLGAGFARAESERQRIR